MSGTSLQLRPPLCSSDFHTETSHSTWSPQLTYNVNLVINQMLKKIYSPNTILKHHFISPRRHSSVLGRLLGTLSLCNILMTIRKSFKYKCICERIKSGERHPLRPGLNSCGWRVCPVVIYNLLPLRSVPNTHVGLS